MRPQRKKNLVKKKKTTPVEF